MTFYTHDEDTVNDVNREDVERKDAQREADYLSDRAEYIYGDL